MSAPITNLQAAQRDAIMNRPAVNGFPHLAETLRRAGVRTNTWWLPAMQSLYETDYGPVLDQGVPLIDGVAEVPAFRPHGPRHCAARRSGGSDVFPRVRRGSLASRCAPLRRGPREPHLHLLRPA